MSKVVGYSKVSKIGDEVTIIFENRIPRRHTHGKKKPRPSEEMVER